MYIYFVSQCCQQIFSENLLRKSLDGTKVNNSDMFDKHVELYSFVKFLSEHTYSYYYNVYIF